MGRPSFPSPEAWPSSRWFDGTAIFGTGKIKRALVADESVTRDLRRIERVFR